MVYSHFLLLSLAAKKIIYVENAIKFHLYNDFFKNQYSKDFILYIIEKNFNVYINLIKYISLATF